MGIADRAMNQNLLYGIVLLSAVGHAVWNALLKNSTDRLIMMVAIRTVGLLYGLIVLSVVGWPATASLPWLLAAALAMWVYQGLLIQGYQAGDLSFVYPNRGKAPPLPRCLAEGKADRRDVRVRPPQGGQIRQCPNGTLRTPGTFLLIAITRVQRRRHLHEAAFLDWLCCLRFCANANPVCLGYARRQAANDDHKYRQ